MDVISTMVFMTQLMGILNITPDSFFDGGKHIHINNAIESGKKFEKIGVDIIDIGGESSRPFATPVSLDEELDRVIPVIEALKSEVKTLLSIDTYKPEVAKKAVEKGASMINDITGFTNPLMQQVAKETGAKIVIMHMLDTPQTMQKKPFYPNGVVEDLLTFFKKQIDTLLKLGIELNQMILDPGIGFGKTVQDNITLISSIHRFKELGVPIMIGASRKSFLGKILNKSTSDLLPATIAINTIALLGGASYIRVHDVQEHRDLIDLVNTLSGSFLKT